MAINFTTQPQCGVDDLKLENLEIEFNPKPKGPKRWNKTYSNRRAEEPGIVIVKTKKCRCICF